MYNYKVKMSLPLAIEFNLFPRQIFPVNHPIIRLHKNEMRDWNNIKRDLKSYIELNKNLIINNAIKHNNLNNLMVLNRYEGGICTLDEKKQLRFELSMWDIPHHINYDKLILRPFKENSPEFFTLVEITQITEALSNEFREIISSYHYIDYKIYIYDIKINYKKYNHNSYKITNDTLQKKYLYDNNSNYKYD